MAMGKGGGLAMLLSGKDDGGSMGLGKPGAMGMMDDPEHEEGGLEERAIRDMFTRGKAGDFKGATEAFGRAWEACAARHEDGEYEED